MNARDVLFEQQIGPQYAAGQHIVVRDSEWTIKEVKSLGGQSQLLVCHGISEIVRGLEIHFITDIEKDIQILDPKNTKLKIDDSPSYRASRLLIESHLRRTVENDKNIHVSQNAAIDYNQYQFDPARQALEQPRQRILIADGVGIGKTIEAGILVSELIARGRGRRILVLTVKSMLLQFQKEFWYRFTIPLTRLDSRGIQRIKTYIPTNHNPFYYFDRSIISIDTLKAREEYRNYVRDAYWDIIIIDEAHNVAKRGAGKLQSQRSKLAELLSDRSDSLIMLSATPHDGVASSFASLMNILDSTAIGDPNDYSEEDYSDKGLVIRRFKKDIESQVQHSFHDPKQYQYGFRASELEECVYKNLAELREYYRKSKRSSVFLGITLEKAILSSPAACEESVRVRLKKLKIQTSTEAREEEKRLNELLNTVCKIKSNNFTKYQGLLKLIRQQKEGVDWNPRQVDDRLVIFTERIASLRWLHHNLKKDLGLNHKQIKIANGRMSDIELQEVIDDFGNKDKPIRLLICSDVASEGINLHYYCHRLIHFDLPWSIMLFQQRNGRIDRYGQTREPNIIYLITESTNEMITRDIDILLGLCRKYDQAVRNIGDPANFLGVHSIEKEIEITRDIISKELDSTVIDQKEPPDAGLEDLIDLFTGNANLDEISLPPVKQISLYHTELAYCEEGFKHLRSNNTKLSYEINHLIGQLSLNAPDDLIYRYNFFPKEIQIDEKKRNILCVENSTDMAVAIEQSRAGEESWPDRQYLWRLSPVVLWLNDRMLTSFERHQAPVLAGVPGISNNSFVFVLSGLIFNERSYPLLYRLIGVEFSGDFGENIIPIEELISRTGLDQSSMANQGPVTDVSNLENLRGRAVDVATHYFKKQRDRLESELTTQLQIEYDKLDNYKERQLQLNLQQIEESSKHARINSDEYVQGIERRFREFWQWVETTMTSSPFPTVRLVCVITGK